MFNLTLLIFASSSPSFICIILLIPLLPGAAAAQLLPQTLQFWEEMQTQALLCQAF